MCVFFPATIPLTIQKEEERIGLHSAEKAEEPTWSLLRRWRFPPRCLSTWHWSPRLQGRPELALELPQLPPHPHPEHLSTPDKFSREVISTVQSDKGRRKDPTTVKWQHIDKYIYLLLFWKSLFVSFLIIFAPVSLCAEHNGLANNYGLVEVFDLDKDFFPSTTLQSGNRSHSKPSQMCSQKVVSVWDQREEGSYLLTHNNLCLFYILNGTCYKLQKNPSQLPHLDSKTLQVTTPFPLFFILHSNMP